jgi:hypothetical protein
MLTVFWVSQAPVPEYSQEGDTAINSACYSEMLTDTLEPGIRSRHRGLLLKRVVLLHDNSRPHTAAHTHTHCRNPQETAVSYNGSSPYSSGLALSGCHLFGPLAEALRSRRFILAQEVKDAAHAFLTAQPKTIFSEERRKLAQQ